MKKNFKYFGLTWLVCFVLFNAITFIIPNEVLGETRFDTGVFWIAYALITISMFAQLAIAYKFIKDDSHEKMFLNIPLLKTGYASISASMVVGAVFMIFPVLPAWIGAIVCLLIAGGYMTACVKASTAAEAVLETEAKVKTQTAFLRTAIVEAETIMQRATTEEMQSTTKKVYEALRYSDPMSNAGLEEVEQEIGNTLKQFKQAVVNNDEAEASSIAAELLLSIQERNTKCKLFK